MKTNYSVLIKISILFGLLAYGLLITISGLKVMQYSFPGPDDYMRIVQVLNWIDGASWFDFNQPRINPPEGMLMHWTRLPDLPIAAVIIATQDLVGRDNAVIIAAFLVPAIFLFGFFLSAGWAAIPVVSQVNAPNAVLAAFMSLPLLANFQPGRFDHHNWQLLLAMLMLGSLIRCLLCPRSRSPAIFAALCVSLSLWIGMEGLPRLFAFCLTLSICWVFWGQKILKPALIFSIALLGFCLIILTLTRVPSQWFVVTCDSFSIAYVGVAGANLVFWSSHWLFVRHHNSIGQRFIVLIICAVTPLISLILLFPECLSHPYSKLDPELSTAWLGLIAEARTVLQLQPAEISLSFSLPVIGLLVVISQLKNTNQRKQLIWITLAVHLLVALLLALMQKRFAALANLYALIPIAWLLSTLFARIKEKWTGFSRIIFICGVLVLIGPFPSFALMVFLGQDKSEAITIRKCDVQSLEPILSTRSDSEVIANFIHSGAQLLFYTKHSISAAGYHRDIKGTLNMYKLFSAKHDDEALEIIQRKNIKLVLVCPFSSELEIYKKPGYRTFYERLIDGNIPPWLLPIQTPEGNEELLFEVIK